MVKLNKLYTRTGDDGSTGLVGGERVAKDSTRVNAYGEVDELMAFIGHARTLAEEARSARVLEMLMQIQNELFDVGAELACPPEKITKEMPRVQESDATRLEKWIDEMLEGLPELRSFVLPGGSHLNASLHVARVVCRRAERSVISLSRQEKVSNDIIVYLNRLSDLLFAMARAEAKRAGVAEYLWKPGKK